MKIICLNGKEFEIGQKANSETITNNFATAQYSYPDFVGSKVYHNATSSDIYSLNFSIHKTLLVDFKESMKTVVTNESEFIEHPTYGKLTHIIIEHPEWGAIKGSIVGSISYNTGSEGDIMCSCIFAEHTPEQPIKRKDYRDENSSAVDAVNLETSANYNVDLSAQDKSVMQSLSDGLNSLYENIQNSAVTSAFNDLDAALSEATLDSLRVMNSFKRILELPNEISPNISNRFELLQNQANSIVATPITSYNIALFNANMLSYNTGIASQAVFISESAQQEASGIKVVPLS